ncbi:MAG: NAD(P)/FAD-dependent oxidoreductase, partial [Bacteroidia bacterium]
MQTQTSFWEYDRYFSGVDVVVIGSGIVGLTAALVMKEREPALRILVIERGALPSGASTKNAGFACFGSVSELLDDLRHSSETDVFSLVEKRYRGLLRLRTRIGDEGLRYEGLGGYELFDEEASFLECADRIAHFNALLEQNTGLKNVYRVADEHISGFGFRGVKHLIHNGGEGQIDTGRMMEALAEKARNAGVIILNGLGIEALHSESEGHVLETSQGHNIKAKRVLICTNGFARQLLPELDVEAARAQVLITDPIPGLRVRGTFHYDKGYYYFRNVGDRILLGGGRNLDFAGEATTEHGLTDLIQTKLDVLLREVILPEQPFSVAMRWSGTMGLGAVKQPILRE